MHAHDDAPSHPAEVHVTSMRVLITVWLSLVVLTGATVAASWVDLGRYNLVVALGIAVLKGSLVVLFFMHMIHDRPFNAAVFIIALLFVALFVGGTLMDALQYQSQLIPGYAPAIHQ